MERDRLVFVDVDTQRDFLEPDGALAIADVAAIRPNLARLTAYARTHRVPVLATACAHALDDEDPEPFPPHCLIGTPGAERVPETAWPGTTHLKRDAQHVGGIPAHLTLHKRYYDAFTHPDADRVIALYRQSDPRFVVYGVATEYCVRAIVEGLLARDCRVAIVVDAIRPIDRSAEPALLTYFANHGVLLTVTDVVCC